MTFKNTVISLVITAVFGSQVALAQDVASVNGTAIPDSQFNQMLTQALNQGQKDSPELHNAIKDELINREIVAQAATKSSLDKTPEAKQLWAQIRQNFLIELYWADYSKKNPITDAQVKAEYDRDINQLQQTGVKEQYKVSLITVATQAEADGISAQLKRGASFEKLVKEKSIDPSRAQGGVVGWVLPTQLNPEIGAAVAKVNKGGVTNPIQTQSGWNIVKVDDKRPFKVPALSEVQNQLRQQLQQRQRIELINKLRSEAKVSVN